MTRIDAYKVINLLAGKRRNDKVNTIAELVKNIIQLESKINDVESQNFYFQMGIESSMKKLEEMKMRYVELSALFNESTIDDLIKTRNDLDNHLQLNRASGSSRFIKSLAMSAIQSDIDIVDDMLQLKLKTNELNTVEYYTNNKGSAQLFYEV